MKHKYGTLGISVSEEQAGSSNIAIPWVFLIKQAFALVA